MKKRTKLLIGTGAAATIALGTAAGFASSGDDKPLSGNTYDQATQAALDHVGGGTVVETEVGDDGAAYGVEIQLSDGSQVEVNLDADFNAIGSEVDDDGPGHQDSEGPGHQDQD